MNQRSPSLPVQAFILDAAIMVSSVVYSAEKLAGEICLSATPVNKEVKKALEVICEHEVVLWGLLGKGLMMKSHLGNRTKMRNSLLLSVLSALFVVCGNSNVRAQDDDIRDTREPSVGSKDILERFIGELVLITPGKGVFPASVETAAGELRLEGSLSISCYETTQELYQVVMGKNPSRWQGPRNSVESVSYQDAERFCDRLTPILRQSNLIDEAANVRLPTDTEWEYCCRGGSAEPFCFGSLADLGKTLDQYAWHTGNAAGNDPAVGVLQPNVFGLYDVHGYLWEFVDAHKHVEDAQQKDAPGPVVWAMGGSWRDSAAQLAADSRIPIPKYASSDAVGFRCVVSQPPAKPKNLSNR